MTGEYIDIVMVGVPWCPYPRDTARWESWSWAGRGRARGRSSLGTPKGRDANLEDMIKLRRPFKTKIVFVGISPMLFIVRISTRIKNRKCMVV